MWLLQQLYGISYVELLLCRIIYVERFQIHHVLMISTYVLDAFRQPSNEC